MKIAAQLLAILSLCAYTSQSLAADDKKDAKKSDKHEHEHKAGEKAHEHGDDHDHGHAKIIAGPNGGRVLTSVEPHLEFFVADDRTVKITALDAKNMPAKISTQSVKIVAGDRKKPTRLKFEVKDGVLVSDGKLPDGNLFPIVIQIKTAKGAKNVNEKFNLDLSKCTGCKYREYACTCDHHAHDEGDGHDHDHDEKPKAKK